MLSCCCYIMFVLRSFVSRLASFGTKDKEELMLES